jgi:hypothetical protein
MSKCATTTWDVSDLLRFDLAPNLPRCLTPVIRQLIGGSEDFPYPKGYHATRLSLLARDRRLSHLELPKSDAQKALNMEAEALLPERHDGSTITSVREKLQ